METIQQLVARLDELDEELIIYVEGRDNWSTSTPGMALPPLPDESDPLERDGLRYFLEVNLAREAVEVWSAWRDGRVPTLEEACGAVTTTPITMPTSAPIWRTNRTPDTWTEPVTFKSWKTVTGASRAPENGARVTRQLAGF